MLNMGRVNDITYKTLTGLLLYSSKEQRGLCCTWTESAQVDWVRFRSEKLHYLKALKLNSSLVGYLAWLKDQNVLTYEWRYCKHEAHERDALWICNHENTSFAIFIDYAKQITSFLLPSYVVII